MARSLHSFNRRFIVSMTPKEIFGEMYMEMKTFSTSKSKRELQRGRKATIGRLWGEVSLTC
ncbi:hypothetical protein J2S16_003504 [Cytobacillus kochii]|uniref:hypothetical protein n=1 Tax=Cytobacillus sp. FSL M8-0252 TaxID=2921621 RepID=UPI00267B272C|nr:hypothetical protein [Cytobacillus kochii]